MEDGGWQRQMGDRSGSSAILHPPSSISYYPLRLYASVMKTGFFRPEKDCAAAAAVL
jgi:hypothetical protein